MTPEFQRAIDVPRDLWRQVKLEGVGNGMKKDKMAQTGVVFEVGPDGLIEDLRYYDAEELNHDFARKAKSDSSNCFVVHGLAGSSKGTKALKEKRRVTEEDPDKRQRGGSGKTRRYRGNTRSKHKGVGLRARRRSKNLD